MAWRSFVSGINGGTLRRSLPVEATSFSSPRREKEGGKRVKTPVENGWRWIDSITTRVTKAQLVSKPGVTINR